ncbi:MAG: hypothetical protein WB493_16545 [Anaeromyxobacteraceae bacterium]
MPPSTPQPPTLLQNVEQVLPFDEIFPTSALLLGGLVLIGVVLLHGIVMRWVQNHVAARDPFIRTSPHAWRSDLVMASVILVLLNGALLEVTLWTAALKYSSLFPTWASAAAYAASSYTTLGNASRNPPPGWGMVGPIIAISGLFTFGWSGSVLVNVVHRVGLARDAARATGAATPRGDGR